MKIAKLLKRIFSLFLIIMMLTLTVGSDWFDANHMAEVDAAEVVVGGVAITAATAGQICLFVGAAALTLYCAGEVYENRDEIAKFGKDVIDSCTEFCDDWVLSFTDTSGQDYVFGSEALEQVQDMEWEVIQGGGGDPGEDPDDNKNGWKDKVLDIFSPANELIGSFTAMGATWLYDTCSNIYNKWVNGDELTPAEQAVIEPLNIIGGVNPLEIAKQWSGEGYKYMCDITYYWDYYDMWSSYKACTIKSGIPDMGYTTAAKYALAYSFNPDTSKYVLNILNADASPYVYDKPLIHFSRFDDGVLIKNSYYWNQTISSVTSSKPISVATNIPIFGSKETAEAYLRGEIEASEAINYSKMYRVADWLADDEFWRGQLVDPLTNIGLSLQQLIDLMKALGLSVYQHPLSAQELADLLKQLLPGADPAVVPELLPGVDPLPDLSPDPALQPDPQKEPIYYPSPDAHPLPESGTDPVDPDPPDEGDDSGGGRDESNDKWVVDLSKFFPFCIPFDLVYLLDVLDAEPQAPRFEIPLKLPAYGIDYTFVIDLSDFDSVAAVFRTFETILFILGLILLTRELIQG